MCVGIKSSFIKYIKEKAFNLANKLFLFSVGMQTEELLDTLLKTNSPQPCVDDFTGFRLARAFENNLSDFYSSELEDHEENPTFYLTAEDLVHNAAQILESTLFHEFLCNARISVNKN